MDQITLSSCLFTWHGKTRIDMRRCSDSLFGSLPHAWPAWQLVYWTSEKPTAMLVMASSSLTATLTPHPTCCTLSHSSICRWWRSCRRQLERRSFCWEQWLEKCVWTWRKKRVQYALCSTACRLFTGSEEFSTVFSGETSAHWLPTTHLSNGPVCRIVR